MVSGGSSSSKSQTAPWEGQAKHLRDLYGRAEELYGEGEYEYGPGRVAGFDPAQTEALGRTERRGREGSSLTRAAQSETERTLSGKYLDPESNPALGRYAEIAERNTRRGFYGSINALGSSMEASGRTGSGGHASRESVLREELGVGLGDLNAKIYGGAYEGERDRMGAAAGRANELANQDYRDTSAIFAAGRERQDQRQKEMDDLVDRFLHNTYASAEKLGEFSNFLGQPVMASKAKSEAWNFGIL